MRDKKNSEIISNLNIVESQILDHIQRFPLLHMGKMAALEFMLLCGGNALKWDDEGKLVNVSPLTNAAEPKISREVAYEIMISGGFAELSMYSKYTPIFNIPENAHPDWIEEIRSFCKRILHVPESMYKAMLWGKLVQSYRHNLAHAKDQLEIRMGWYHEMQTKIREMVEAKGEDWEWVLQSHFTAEQDAICDEIIDEILAEEKAEQV